MKTIDAIKALNDIASAQKGMFTTAQAQRTGIERYTVSRLEKLGNIERLAKGVYRMGGAPSQREGDMFAVWLSLNPGRCPGSPPAERDPVAMGAAAAWLHGIGEVGPTPYEFCTDERRQTQRPDLVLRKRKIEAADVTVVSGIPATTPSRTVVDLIDYREDLSLVANVLNDALARGLVTDEARLRKEIDSRAARAGLPKGSSLYELLFAGVSVASVSKRLGHTSMNTTQETYLHVIRELENKDVDIVMRALSTLM